jgi:hypothetical protein
VHNDNPVAPKRNHARRKHFFFPDNIHRCPPTKPRLDMDTKSQSFTETLRKQAFTKYQKHYVTTILYRIAGTHPGADYARCSLTCVIKRDTPLHHQKSLFSGEAV